MNFPTPSITGHTRFFAVLGHPVSHSLSPQMHNAALRALGMDALYLAFDVGPDDLMGVLRGMSRMGFLGANLTIPHKETAFRGVDHLAPTAERAGSVNTVLFRPDGSLEGHSTDGYGLVGAIQDAFGRGIDGSSVLVVGCGGAGRAAAIEAASQGASRVILANRTAEKAASLAEELRDRFPDVPVSPLETWPPAPGDVRCADLILNSTSLGMKQGDVIPLTAPHFREGQDFLDMTYVMDETPMMRASVQGGARAANGLGMLLHQGARSLEIWTGRKPPVDAMRSALRHAIQTRNP